jgi:hypothetical protein
MEAANASALLASQAEKKAAYENRKNDYAEAQYWGGKEGLATGGTVALAGTMAGAGAIAGSFLPVVGNIIGAVIGGVAGLGLGLLSSAGIAHGADKQEEAIKASLEASAEFKNAMRVYQTVGDAMFNSETALAEALGKTTSELTSVERELVRNSEETKAMAQAYSAFHSTEKGIYVETGKVIVGEEKSEGE